ncbi:glutaminyl-peptide cyclotransferase [Nitrospirillum amazonense]|uniref:glutaminyl-peptide cyclotransferase n=1 Tax=Nitrospirillum amazonense TaxID=28077 RepID=UPI00241285FA|nr:glutaminyl-peptide cyclotransferase [Nitrospirillum amazonense]MDG3443670.1 glutaminyl-peptide cyclotransferase [Nitrospirillum amazonense]
MPLPPVRAPAHTHVRALLLALALAILPFTAHAQEAPRKYGVEVVHTYPHDPQAFTEGLFYLDGFLYESTGLEQHSTIRKVDLATGTVLQSRELDPRYFGEGIVNWKDRLVQLTYRTEVGFVYGLGDFKARREFHYRGEGWALTQDGHRLIMSDGTPELRFLDPETLAETGRITVTDSGYPIRNLNELEFVKGEILANIWQTNLIARINPTTGAVTGWIDLTPLEALSGRTQNVDNVLNGIAYDAKEDRLFVTGKRWPKLFEIKLVPVK